MREHARAGGVLLAGLIVLYAPPAWAATLPEHADSHVVRLPGGTPGDVAGLGLNPVRALDYGSFVWLELTSADLARLQDSEMEFQEQVSPYTLRLGEVSFDPLGSEPTFAAGWAPDPPAEPDLHLVQFAGPTRGEWLEDLESRGLEVVQYVPPHTYVVWGEAEVRNEAAVGEAVRWAGSFSPAYRVHPRWRDLNHQLQDVKVLMYRGADTTAIIGELEALGGQLGGRRVLGQRFETARFALPGDQFEAAARVPGVYSIQVVPTDGGLRGEMSNQVNVNNVDQNNSAYPGYLDWLTDVNLSGAGVIMADVDSGVQDNHPNLASRMVSCTGSTCGGVAQSSHGTHTAGIMAADGSSGITDGFGFLRGLGMAPGAHLVEQLYSPTYTQPGGMLVLITQSYDNGALLSGNSWGPAGTARGYDDDTMQVDIGVRDADPNTPGNQPFSYVLSIMNGYGGTSSQGTPDEAKNIFTIGSTKMQTSGGAQILDINDLSANSAHGPALDGRTIPHMVAPGCQVDSTVTGSSYGLLCGTSMASPHVTGAIALFIEYYRNLPDSPPDPSPALIKAAFLPVAKDLAGFRDADGGILGHPFDSKQGWGRMDAEAVLDPPLGVRYFDNPVIFDNTGESWEVALFPQDPAEPMRVMLVWTDAPGHGLGGSTPAWNNDLDLMVEVGDDTYHGNWFGPDGWSAPGGSADGMNNTEGVLLGPTAPGPATIRVLAADINSDGIPGQGDGTDQDFALVCYNCIEETGFTLAATPPLQDVCAPNDAGYDIDVGQILDYADPVTLSATGEPAGTTIDFSVNPVTPPGSSVLTIGNTGAAPAGSAAITIEGTAPPLTTSTTVQLNLYADVPGISSLTLPVNDATGVALTPTFTWTPAPEASAYDLEVATDVAFTDIVVAVTALDTTSYVLEDPLEWLTAYWWRVGAHNVCGAGAESTTFTFTTRDIPAVLLVDDDDNSPDVRSYYTDALDAIGRDYDIWDTNNTDHEPSVADLAPYSLVIWFTGDEFGGAAGPGSAGEAALASFLDGGNFLFISSQDYYYDRGQTSFMSNYLGAASIGNDVGQTTVTGTGPVFAGRGPYALAYPLSNYSDRVTPDVTAELGFQGDQGDAGVTKETGDYRTVFWGFPFEAVADPSDRAELMQTVIQWCGSGMTAPPLAGDSVPKNRYISFLPNSGMKEVAFQIELIDSVYFPGSTMTRWVDTPNVDGYARLTDARVQRVWGKSVIHVGDCGIVPAAMYEIRATPDGVEFSEALAVATVAKPDKYWGDCVGEFDGTKWLGPDGIVNFDDVQAAVQTFEGAANAPHLTWIDVDDEVPNLVVNMTDIQLIILAFEGAPYPFSDPADCP